MSISISEAHKHSYASLFVMKLLDLGPEDGGLEFPVVLPPELYAFDALLEHLAVEGQVSIDRKRGRYVLTPAGIETLGVHIDEAEAHIEEFDDLEVEQVVEILRSRGLDPLRVRFLWGWYQGEFDDPVLFQERRGVAAPVRDWAAYVLSDEFYVSLADDLRSAE